MPIMAKTMTPITTPRMIPLLDFFSPGAGVIGVLALGVTGAAAGVGSVELKNGLLAGVVSVVGAGSLAGAASVAGVGSLAGASTVGAVSVASTGVDAGVVLKSGAAAGSVAGSGVVSMVGSTGGVSPPAEVSGGVGVGFS